MTIYTGNGDNGYTHQIDGRRVCKADPPMEAVGTLDELNSHIGLCLCRARDDNLPDLAEALLLIQNELFVIGSQLASAGTSLAVTAENTEDSNAVKRIEQNIDRAMQIIGELDSFILPGGSELAARFHVARSVCRRAERATAALAETGVPIDPAVLKYINRLSDLLFVFARLANHEKGFKELPWRK